MTKKYNIGSKSDMRKFKNDLCNSIYSCINTQINNLEIEVTCPKCNQSFIATSGSNICPNCKSEINVELNVKA